MGQLTDQERQEKLGALIEKYTRAKQDVALLRHDLYEMGLKLRDFGQGLVLEPLRYEAPPPIDLVEQAMLALQDYHLAIDARDEAFTTLKAVGVALAHTGGEAWSMVDDKAE